MGIVTSFARIGGALTPVLCSYFADDNTTALWTCVAVALTAAGVVCAFPHDTAGRPLEDAVPTDCDVDK